MAVLVVSFEIALRLNLNNIAKTRVDR